MRAGGGAICAGRGRPPPPGPRPCSLACARVGPAVRARPPLPRPHPCASASCSTAPMPADRQCTAQLAVRASAMAHVQSVEASCKHLLERRLHRRCQCVVASTAAAADPAGQGDAEADADAATAAAWVSARGECFVTGHASGAVRVWGMPAAALGALSAGSLPSCGAHVPARLEQQTRLLSEQPLYRAAVLLSVQ